eukprot:gene14855-biopygen10915
MQKAQKTGKVRKTGKGYGGARNATVEDADDAEEAEIAYGGARPQKTTEDHGRNSFHDESIPRSGRCGRRRMVAQGHGRPWKSVEGKAWKDCEVIEYRDDVGYAAEQGVRRTPKEDMRMSRTR